MIENELERKMDRGTALAFIEVLLTTKIVFLHFQGRMGFGEVPQKTTDFDSAKPDRKARCLEMLTYTLRCVEFLIDEINNREDEQPQRAEDPDQTDIEDVLDSPPERAVIVWHPNTKDEQREVVAVTEIENKAYLVRHLENGSSETLFQGNSWADLVEQVMTKQHRLEPYAEPVEEPGPQPPAPVGAQ